MSTTLRLLGSRVDVLTFPQVLNHIQDLVASRRFHQVITTNTLMLLEAENDPVLQAILENCSLSVPESAGILWASRHLDQPLHEKVPGIDLFTSLCQRASREHQSVYLLGAKPGVADVAARMLKQRYPDLRIAGTHHGYFSNDDVPHVLAAIRAAAPAFVFVGMNVPAQEKWIAAHASRLGACVVMGVGGSFDVIAGRLKRAPRWMQRLGIEWLYRLAQEPWRWRRIAQLPLFVLKIIRSQSARTAR